jgi:hypothetical protein
MVVRSLLATCLSAYWQTFSLVQVDFFFCAIGGLPQPVLRINVELRGSQRREITRRGIGMLITLKRVLLTGLFLACAPRFGAATPITWDFEGEIFFSGVSDLPVGTPVSIEWSFDDEQPNACPAGDPGGLYRGMSATVVLGDFTYTTSGFFVPGRLPSACTGAWPDCGSRIGAARSYSLAGRGWCRPRHSRRGCSGWRTLPVTHCRPRPPTRRGLSCRTGFPHMARLR